MSHVTSCPCLTSVFPLCQLFEGVTMVITGMLSVYKLKINTWTHRQFAVCWVKLSHVEMNGADWGAGGAWGGGERRGAPWLDAPVGRGAELPPSCHRAGNEFNWCVGSVLADSSSLTHQTHWELITYWCHSVIHCSEPPDAAFIAECWFFFLYFSLFIGSKCCWDFKHL